MFLIIVYVCDVYCTRIWTKDLLLEMLFFFILYNETVKHLMSRFLMWNTYKKYRQKFNFFSTSVRL